MTTSLRLNKSASRAVQLLEFLSDREKAPTQQEISTYLHLPKSSTYELVYTLMATGVVEYDNEDLKTFRLGIKVFEIGMSVLQRSGFHQIARPLLEKLSSETNEVVFLAIENEGAVVYLDRVEKERNLARFANTIGSRGPMYCTGLGKALLATYPTDKVSDIWQKAQPQHQVYTATTHTSLPSLLSDLNQIKQRGYAIDNAERATITYCLAAPVYDYSGQAVCAISISCMLPAMKAGDSEHYGRRINATALEISRQLGYRGKTLYP